MEEKLLKITDARILSTSQFSHMCNTSMQVGRRWLRRLQASGYITKKPVPLSGKRGRSEQVFSLTGKGFRKLKEAKRLASRAREEECLANGISINHQMLLNSIRVAFTQTVQNNPLIKVQFLAFNSPLNQSIRERVPIDPQQTTFRDFEPDATVCLQRRTDSCLFYVEADCGTESLKSNNPNGLSEKIINYSIQRGLSAHMHWEKKFGKLKQGFRVLFVTQDTLRAQQIVRLLGNYTNSDFIWTSDIKSMQAKGIEAKIWSKGGHVEPRYSLFDSIEGS